MKILLLPLSIFQVEYEIGAGRPYSEVDTLVLRAVAEGANTVEALCDIFCLPPRLLIEVLVTLARAGWVAIGATAGSSFSMTPQGNLALQQGEVPEFLSIRRDVGKIFMEHFTGKLISQNEIRYDSENNLQKDGIWDSAYRLPSKIFNNRLDEGQVGSLLRKERHEWIRQISTPTLISKDLHWLRVGIDENGSVLNLPELWRSGLQSLLIEEAAQANSQSFVNQGTIDKWFYAQHQTARDKDISGAYSTTITADSLLVTNQQHVQQLQTALTDAKSTILIASAFLNPASLEPEIRTWILSALQRGVHVDLLWGYKAGTAEQSEQATLNWLKQLRKDAGAQAGKLRFNSSPTDSHAKLLIYDVAEKQYRAYVGSYNWLSTPARIANSDITSGRNISICLQHPGLIADLCFSVAGLWSTGKGNSMSDAPDRWKRIASHQGQLASHQGQQALKSTQSDEGVAPSGSSNLAEVQIIRRGHDDLMRDFLLNSQKRCAILSHRIGAIAPTRLAPLLKRSYEQHFSLSVWYGETDMELEDIRNVICQAKGMLTHRYGVHSKVLIGDDRLVVGSYNYLSADPFGKNREAREISVLIKEESIADVIWQILTSTDA